MVALSLKLDRPLGAAGRTPGLAGPNTLYPWMGIQIYSHRVDSRRIDFRKETPRPASPFRLVRGTPSLVGQIKNNLGWRHAPLGNAAQHIEQDCRPIVAFIAFEYGFQPVEGAFKFPSARVVQRSWA